MPVLIQSDSTSEQTPTLRRTLNMARVILLFASLATPACLADAVQDGPAFHVDEKLTYRLRWGLITAGSATLEVRPDALVNREWCRRFVLTARTTGIVDRIYRVRTTVESYMLAPLQRSLLYLGSQREGRRHREVRVVFDWEKGEAHYTNFDEPRPPLPLPANAVDPLGVLYAFRQQRLATGQRLEMPVTDGKRCVTGAARIIGEERVQTKAGVFDTFVVEVDMRHVRGVFRKSPGAKLRVWVTRDSRHLPVRVSSRVIVGRFVGELIAAEGLVSQVRPPRPRPL